VTEIAVCSQRRGEKSRQSWNWKLYEERVIDQVRMAFEEKGGG
jgi:hypothetical protein